MNPSRRNTLRQGAIVAGLLLSTGLFPQYAQAFNAKAFEAKTLADVLKAPAPAAAANRRERGTALKEGRKAAFTLRLDVSRHLRLRLACTIDNRSAQQIVVEALDRFLEAKPGLDDLARRALRS
jgi:hypothetical protein